MLKTLFFIATLFASFQVRACESAIPLNTHEARQARHVFVFRVMSTSAGEDDGKFSAMGKIRVLANVRGKTTATEISYRTGYCGGISLDPGMDYVGFLSSDARTFEVGTGNVVPLFFGRFDRREADNLEALLRGRKELKEAFPLGPEAMSRFVLPPPPCPDQS